MKPDTIDDNIPIFTQKPDSREEEIAYNKPNTYEEEDKRTTLPQEVLNDLIVRAEFIDGKRAPIQTRDDEEEEKADKKSSLPQEVLDDLIVRTEFINGKVAPIKTRDDDDDDDQEIIEGLSVTEEIIQRPAIKNHMDEETNSNFTSSLLSHIPSSTTGLTSSPPIIPLSPSTSTISSNSSITSTATTRLALLRILKSKPMEDLISFDIRKYSLTRPQEQDIYIKGTKEQVYKKVQPHSYSWGFQNILYKVTNEKIKIAEARRRAFKKEITIEWGDFPINNTESFNNNNNEEDDTNSIISAITENTKSNQLYNKTNSHLLFTYETEFEGFKIRWKRASLISHDMVCEIKLEQKKKWHVIAEFDSHRMGYFIHLGEIIIDKNALKLVDRSDHFEAHIIITCCTLIDLMREVVEKAVGISKGGVVGSD